MRKPLKVALLGCGNRRVTASRSVSDSGGSGFKIAVCEAPTTLTVVQASQTLIMVPAEGGASPAFASSIPLEAP